MQQISYYYDVFGQLIETEATVGSTTTTTRYGVDGWNPAKLDATGTSNFDVWAVFNATGSLITRQLQGDGIDQHLGYVAPNGTGGGIAYWYLTDHLGSTRSVIDNSATVQDALVYDAYGNITSQTASPATVPLYTYTGRELHVETGLQYNRARWYDAATGRWMTQDPMGFAAGDWNLYRYVNNHPVAALDPSGNQPVQAAPRVELVDTTGNGETWKVQAPVIGTIRASAGGFLQRYYDVGAAGLGIQRVLRPPMKKGQLQPQQPPIRPTFLFEGANALKVRWIQYFFVDIMAILANNTRIVLPANMALPKSNLPNATKTSDGSILHVFLDGPSTSAYYYDPTKKTTGAGSVSQYYSDIQDLPTVPLARSSRARILSTTFLAG